MNYKNRRGQGKGKDGFLFVGDAPNIPHIDVIENDAIADCTLWGLWPGEHARASSSAHSAFSWRNEKF